MLPDRCVVCDGALHGPPRVGPAVCPSCAPGVDVLLRRWRAEQERDALADREHLIQLCFAALVAVIAWAALMIGVRSW